MPHLDAPDCDQMTEAALRGRTEVRPAVAAAGIRAAGARLCLQAHPGGSGSS
jgi:hypothetical protein